MQKPNPRILHHAIMGDTTADNLTHEIMIRAAYMDIVDALNSLEVVSNILQEEYQRQVVEITMGPALRNMVGENTN